MTHDEASDQAARDLALAIAVDRIRRALAGFPAERWEFRESEIRERQGNALVAWSAAGTTAPSRMEYIAACEPAALSLILDALQQAVDIPAVPRINPTFAPPAPTLGTHETDLPKPE